MRYLCVLALLLSCASLRAEDVEALPQKVQPAEPPTPAVAKLPVPGLAQLAENEKLLKGLFKADYAKTDPAGRMQLYAKLMQQAKESKGDPPSEYVLLREARDTAVSAGDAGAAVAAHAEASALFALDFEALSSELERLETAAKASASAVALSSIYLKVIDELIDAKKYELAGKVASRAEGMTRWIKDAAMLTRIKSEVARAQELRRESIAAAAAAKVLEKTPGDPAACLAVGRFAFILGNHAEAFGAWTKCGNERFKTLADLELKNPENAAQQAALADCWKDLASNTKEQAFKAAAEGRARFWYQQALGGAAGLVKLSIESKLKALPPPPGVQVAEATPAIAPVSAVKPTTVTATAPAVKPLPAPSGQVTPDTPFASVLGIYYKHGGKVPMFVNFWVPNGTNIYNPEQKVQMAEKLNGEVGYVGTASIYIPEDGTLLIQNKGFYVTLDGIKYEKFGTGKEPGEVKLTKGLKKLEISSGNHGQSYIESCSLKLTHKESKTVLPMFNKYSEIIEFYGKHVQRGGLRDMSNWSPATAERLR